MKKIGKLTIFSSNFGHFGPFHQKIVHSVHDHCLTSETSHFKHTHTLDWQAFLILVIWCATEIKASPEVVTVHCWITVHRSISDCFVIWTEHSKVVPADLFCPIFRWVSHLQRDDTRRNQVQAHCVPMSCDDLWSNMSFRCCIEGVVETGRADGVWLDVDALERGI